MQDPSGPEPKLSRRGFLGHAALVAGAGLTAGAAAAPAVAQPRQGNPQPLTPATRPVSHIPKDVARHIIKGDCSLCVLGDSISTDGSSWANLPYGMQRTWRPQQWVGRFGRGTVGPPAWALGMAFNTFYYSPATGGEFTTISPGNIFPGGELAISPNAGSSMHFGETDVPDVNGFFAEVSLNDVFGYAAGPWPESLPMAGRLIHWRGGGHMVEAIQIQGKRGATFAGSTIVPMTGPAGVTFADVDCGNGATTPAMTLVSAPGIDERLKRAYLLGFGFWRHDGSGNRLPGFSLTQIGEAGWTAADHLAPWRCSDAHLSSFLAASLKPNTFLLHIANQTAPEMNALNAGNHSIYKHNLNQIIVRYTLAALNAGAQPPIRWLLVNPYPIGAPELNSRLRARAMLELVMEDPANRGLIDLHQLAGVRHGQWHWYTVDGAHPNQAGAAYLAALMWSQIAAAAQ